MCDLQDSPERQFNQVRGSDEPLNLRRPTLTTALSQTSPTVGGPFDDSRHRKEVKSQVYFHGLEQIKVRAKTMPPLWPPHLLLLGKYDEILSNYIGLYISIQVFTGLY